MERIRNVVKRDRTKGVRVEETPVAKRPKKQLVLLSRYPVATASTSPGDSPEDLESIDGHIQSMKTEMGKERPRDTLLKPLMKITYTTRRDSILNFSSVAEVLETYPALKRPSLVRNILCFNFHLDFLGRARSVYDTEQIGSEVIFS